MTDPEPKEDFTDFVRSVAGDLLALVRFIWLLVAVLWEFLLPVIVFAFQAAGVLCLLYGVVRFVKWAWAG